MISKKTTLFFFSLSDNIISRERLANGSPTTKIHFRVAPLLTESRFTEHLVRFAMAEQHIIMSEVTQPLEQPFTGTEASASAQPPSVTVTKALHRWRLTWCICPEPSPKQWERHSAKSSAPEMVALPQVPPRTTCPNYAGGTHGHGRSTWHHCTPVL